ncbi:MarR family transcriptional regulator [Solihabitans fulvus]|uniref:MarR family transcriptional regulator n=1 Tax=Solihabitans fulvus TaxID=1892852 RepID=A0A5B2XKA8_9PSEU|nr:MarR family transcriptional regulator [Solihabitans fulvus]KAA2264308.1 MarR family transcriptional regulator [Solihabitans fulvus]
MPERTSEATLDVAPPAELEDTTAGDARTLTEVVTRLRRALRTSIRSDWPWESLPMAQVELLQTLAERPPMRVGELAAALRLAPNTVSGLISQLMESGLVARNGDPADRRVARLTVTEAGHDKLAAWQRGHEQRIGSALDRLGARERAAVVRALPALDRLVDHLLDG